MILLKSQDLLHCLTQAAQMACMAAILSMLAPLAAFAQGDDAISEHIAAAEDALKSNDFWRASSEYRKAAELSDDSDVAKQATRIAYTYGFNDDALASAKRWVALDDSNDEALLYLALLELRAGDIKSSRNEFKKLLQRGDEPADERLISLIPFLSDENAADADALMRQLSKPYKKSPYAHYAAAVLALYASDSDEALKRAKRATELKPDWLKPHLLYARALLMSGEDRKSVV